MVELSDRARRFLDASRVARLTTVSGEGEPYPVPICFAAIEDGGRLRLYSVVDEKPKRTRDPSRELRRVRNIEQTGRAAVIVDHYEDDWTRLGWVQLRGSARLVTDAAERGAALDALRARYPQYETMQLEEAALLRVDVERASEWWANG
jgi:PPOX class probable F420-dependent enzyme